MTRLCVVLFLFLLVVLTQSVFAQPNAIRTWTGAIDNNFRNTLNWTPNGPPEGAKVFIPQATAFPVLSTPLFDSVHSIHIQNGGRFDIVTGGVLNTNDSIRVSGRGVFNIGSTGTMSIGGKLTIDSACTVHVASPITVTSIRGNVTVGGAFIIDPGVAAIVTCESNWIRGQGSGFSAGNSRFIFGNLQSLISVERGTFYDFVVRTSRGVLLTQNIQVNNRLVLLDSLLITPGDTLTIANSDTSAIADSTGFGRIVRGYIRRAIHPTLTNRYWFHHGNVYMRFYLAGTRPTFVSLAEYPDSNINPRGYDVNRFYDVGAEGGTSFRAGLALRYDQTELGPGVDESQLRLFRSTNNGQTWILVGGTVDTLNNFVFKDTIAEFSKWAIGSPTGPLFVGTRTGGVSEEFHLFQNFPNPFNPVTDIDFAVPALSRVRITICNVLGQEIRLITDQDFLPGAFTVRWDSRDNNGRIMPSGVYFYRLNASTNGGKNWEFTQVRKMVLLK